MTETNTATIATAKVDIKTFLLSHAIWIVAILVALVIGHIALQEHDARVLAEAQIKTSEATVKNLQDQITATNAQAAQKVQTIVKIVHDLGPAPTPAQVVTAVPQIVGDIPLNARTIPNDPVDMSVAALPFLQFVQEAATDKINLAACKSDLTNETAIVTAKNVEITALRKKPSFFHRLTGIAKTVGIGIGIGILLTHGL